MYYEPKTVRTGNRACCFAMRCPTILLLKVGARLGPVELPNGAGSKNDMELVRSGCGVAAMRQHPHPIGPAGKVISNDELWQTKGFDTRAVRTGIASLIAAKQLINEGLNSGSEAI